MLTWASFWTNSWMANDLGCHDPHVITYHCNVLKSCGLHFVQAKLYPRSIFACSSVTWCTKMTIDQFWSLKKTPHSSLSQENYGVCFILEQVCHSWQQHHIDGLVQEWHNSIANALELRLSYTNPLTVSTGVTSLLHKPIDMSIMTFHITINPVVQKLVPSLPW